MSTIVSVKKSLTILISLGYFLITTVTAQAAPTIWRVSDQDTTLYIMGTIHLLPPRTEWLNPQIEAAIKMSDAVILEMTPDQQKAEVMRPLMAKYALLPVGESIMDHLSPDLFNRLQGHFRDDPKAITQIARFRPWYVGLTIVMEKYKYEGFDPNSGVDKQIQNLALKLGKPILGFETADFQIGTFASLSPKTTEVMLNQTLEDLPYVGNLTREMILLWQNGRDEGLGTIMNRDLASIPEAAEKLLYARNRTWAGQLYKMMEQPGVIFVAVGAGHLAGRENLISLLKDKGLTVAKEPTN